MFPEGICPCGGDLDDARDLGVRYSHQVTDLPGARAVTIQHDRHEVQCACGRAHVADAPPQAAGAPGTVTYGLNFQAWRVFLMVMHHVPVERCADILESMSGTRPSDGWVHKLLERAARAVAAANRAIRALIILARVICGDETPLRAGPGPKARKKYLQVACTDLLTCYFLGGRDLPSFRNFVYSDLHGAVVVHDGTSTTTPSTASATSFAPSTCSGTWKTPPDLPEAIWPGQIAEASRPDPHRQPGPRPGPGRRPRRDDRGAPDAVPPRRHRRAVPGPPRPGAKSKQPPARTLLECLRPAKPTCCGSSPTPPSPRPATRPNATCGPPRPSRRSPAPLGEDHPRPVRHPRIRSTAAKHGIGVFTAIRDALAGNPWIPPIQASA